jgi:hypothetical protein
MRKTVELVREMQVPLYVMLIGDPAGEVAGRDREQSPGFVLDLVQAANGDDAPGGGRGHRRRAELVKGGLIRNVGPNRPIDRRPDGAMPSVGRDSDSDKPLPPQCGGWCCGSQGGFDATVHPSPSTDVHATPCPTITTWS